MKLASAIATVQRNIRNHGYRAASYDAAIRSINLLIYFKTLMCVVVEQVDPRALSLPGHLRYVQMDEAMLSSFSAVQSNELDQEFVRDALLRGDRCFAVLDGNTLASYGWYSTAPTLVDRDLRLHFNHQYIYMYKGFTAKAYRGQRLHAIGMMRALQECLGQGFKGLVAYVESNNFDSLKSCYRMGWRDCGYLRVLKLADRYFIRSSPQCSDYGLELRSDTVTAVDPLLN